MERILIVDDEESILHSFRRILKNKDYEIVTAKNGEKAINYASNTDINLIIMDINMPEMNGLEAFRKIKQVKPKIPIIMMTGYGSTEITIETMKMGAYDYITKPFNIDEIQVLIDKALTQSKLTQEISIEEEEKGDEETFEVQRIIGSSPPMQSLYKLIGKVAGSNIPVLVQGESGTGKELVARALYSYSDRKEKPFIAVNCAAIPETLLESELFGYEKGAFTGATERRIGRFEQCNGGTLFLDEIGDMPMVIQSKLLRVLQCGELERLGSNDTISVDVRILSATNTNLEEAITANRFREDLFYRLNVVMLHMPPLRDRKEDIPILIDYFIRKFNNELKKKIEIVPDAVRRKLVEYYWPGNVRELENVIKRAVVLSKGNVIREDDVILKETKGAKAGKHPGGEVVISNEGASLSEILESYLEPMFNSIMNCAPEERADVLTHIEESLVKKSLHALNNNQVQVSKLLGMTRNTLRKRIKEHNLGDI
ncbi:sigma-54-dependent transcriptional regulator [Candidatus Margulisiibacteriota bacterium]